MDIQPSDPSFARGLLHLCASVRLQASVADYPDCGETLARLAENYRATGTELMVGTTGSSQDGAPRAHQDATGGRRAF